MPAREGKASRAEFSESGSVQGLGYVSQAIQRALDVVDAISEAPHGLTLTELADAFSLPKSSVLRLVANLEMRHYVELDQHRRYRIGLRVFSIGGHALADSHLRAGARPYLKDLALRWRKFRSLLILYIAADPSCVGSENAVSAWFLQSVMWSAPSICI